MLKSLQDDFETQNENEITKKQVNWIIFVKDSIIKYLLFKESTNIVDNNNNNNNNPLNHSNSLNGINISNQTNQNVNNLSTGSHSYNERLSISNERPNYFIGVTPFQQQFEIKRKSQYDISHTLGTSKERFSKRCISLGINNYICELNTLENDKFLNGISLKFPKKLCLGFFLLHLW